MTVESRPRLLLCTMWSWSWGLELTNSVQILGAGIVQTALRRQEYELQFDELGVMSSIEVE